MFLNDDAKRQLQLDTMPAGYELVESGNIMPEDIRWNPYLDKWLVSEPVTADRHKLIINDPVSNFHGICRKKELNSGLPIPAPVVPPCFVDFKTR